MIKLKNGLKMTLPIMPQGTAIWLVENTALTFEQIAKFCGLHVLEVQALADEQVSAGMIGVDPIKLGQLTQEEIDRCSADSSATLSFATPKFTTAPRKKSKRKYTPLLKRQERPDAIAWLIKFYPEMSDANICSLLSTTKATVLAIRNKTHSRISELKPKDPVLLGFCSQMELDAAIAEINPQSVEES
ncbi:MAG: DUF1013 domain-containing protein [Holosporaceae bacterium]|nr:DUF1013 domain-containing protein [Holosporaceae bacterium]